MSELSQLAQVISQTQVVEQAQETARRKGDVQQQQTTRHLADRAEIRGRQVEQSPEAGEPRIDTEQQGGREGGGGRPGADESNGGGAAEGGQTDSGADTVAPEESREASPAREDGATQAREQEASRAQEKGGRVDLKA